MNKIRKFLRLRKQNDFVKIAIIFFVIGICLFGSAVSRGLKIYNANRNPVEYIIAYSKGAVSEKNVSEILAIENVEYATPQNIISLEIGTSPNKETIECYKVSKEYMEKAFGVDMHGGMQYIYLTEKCYDKIRESLNKSSGQIVDKKTNEFQEKYTAAQEDGEREVARFVKLKETDETECAFMITDAVKLYNDDANIRAYVTKSDMLGTVQSDIENAGYSIQNTDAIAELENERNIDMLNLKYQLIISALCILYVWSIFKVVKRHKVLS